MENIFLKIKDNPGIDRILWLSLGLFLILILVQIAKKVLGKRVKVENWYKAKKIVNAAGYVLFVLLVLGVASAGIAFALQEVIASVAGWLAIMVGDFYRPGDRVQVGGIKGDVIDQGVLRTTVMELGDWIDGDLYNGRIVRIANSFVFKEPVFNYSADFPFLWDEIKIPIKFGSDYDRTRKLLKDIADRITGECVVDSQTYWDNMVRNYSIENATLNTMVTMSLTDNRVEYTVRYVVNYRNRRTIQDALISEILREISISDGAIELASNTINITEIPPIKIVN